MSLEDLRTGVGGTSTQMQQKRDIFLLISRRVPSQCFLEVTFLPFLLPPSVSLFFFLFTLKHFTVKKMEDYKKEKKAKFNAEKQG